MLQEILEILNTQHFPAHELHFTCLTFKHRPHDIERRGSQVCRTLAAAAAALSGDKQMRSRQNAIEQLPQLSPPARIARSA